MTHLILRVKSIMSLRFNSQNVPLSKGLFFKLRFLLKLQQKKGINCNNKNITTVSTDAFILYDKSVLNTLQYLILYR